MKNPFRKQRNQVSPAPQEPRIAGHSEPHYQLAAKEAFLEVLIKASEVRRPSGKNEGFVDSATELREVIRKAEIYCNDELKSRMHSLWEVVVEESMGSGSGRDTQAAQQYFVLGCRLALGTND